MVLLDLSNAKSFYSVTDISKALSFRDFTDICFASKDVDDIVENCFNVIETIPEETMSVGLGDLEFLDDDYYMQLSYEAIFETINEFFDITKHPVQTASEDRRGRICVTLVIP